MRLPASLWTLLALQIVTGVPLFAAPIKLARQPALSPDGQSIAFAWQGDVWAAPLAGGAARRLTLHPADDGDPHFSPDGSQLAFTSDRGGGRQVYVMDAAGGEPRQVTFHSEGYAIEDWYADGKSLLVSGRRDHHWRHAERFFRVLLNERRAEELLFDAYGESGSLDKAGRRLLFVREGERWWRKGYRGSRAAQIWMFDTDGGEFSELLHEEYECKSPLWAPGGNAFYYVSERDGAFNLYRHSLKSKKSQQLTHFEDDGVVFPALSRDGKTLVFRRLFDLYSMKTSGGAEPQLIELEDDGDAARSDVWRRTLNRAGEASFAADGLEIALVAGGDLWVMDTELREPRQITDTPEEERSAIFSPDGKAVLFVSDTGGEADIWKAERTDDSLYWWQNERFRLARLSEDAAVESDLAFSPDGLVVAFVRDHGELWLMEPDGKNPRQIVGGFDPPDFDFSPDGKWIVYSQADDDFNRDVWIVPVDGSREPFNLSRHPDNDYAPRWSPDGRLIAFTGRRVEEEVDIYYVWLREEDYFETSRGRKLETAIETIQKARQEGPGESKSDTDSKSDPAESAGEVRIDFDGIQRRIQRVSIADSEEQGLFWSPDSKKLAFAATVAGRPGTYTIEIPDTLAPQLLSSTTLTRPAWLKENSKIVGVSDGIPASLDAGGAKTAYPFSTNQEISRGARHQAAFDQCWRTMRDWWYDPRMNNRNWNEIRRKYRDLAGAGDAETLTEVVSMMLGELNGSHLGFYARGEEPSSADDWSTSTAHLGVRFDPEFKGPGLKVAAVLPDGPAESPSSRLEAGDVILAIDGVTVDPAMDLTQVLNGRLDRDIRLRVKRARPAAAAAEQKAPATDSKSPGDAGDKKEDEEEIRLRPISFAAARVLLYDKMVQDNRAYVEEKSDGRLGYLHIQAMNQASFVQFQQELFEVGFGKEALVIDVRENGGGFTTDHLLTALTQPRHAITVPRGGGRGYPQDRTIYATWHKPIIVLCNQNSFSNAEIFSHAIKTLARGKLVGVPTAGGVISTGAVSIMDVGLLRQPFRAWFVRPTGEDMELNGAVPDVVLWPRPGQIPAGEDIQLDKAIELLLRDVEQWQARPQVELRYRSERGEEAAGE